MINRSSAGVHERSTRNFSCSTRQLGCFGFCRTNTKRFAKSRKGQPTALKLFQCKQANEKVSLNVKITSTALLIWNCLEMKEASTSNMVMIRSTFAPTYMYSYSMNKQISKVLFIFFNWSQRFLVALGNYSRERKSKRYGLRR